MIRTLTVVKQTSMNLMPHDEAIMFVPGSQYPEPSTCSVMDKITGDVPYLHVDLQINPEHHPDNMYTYLISVDIYDRLIDRIEALETTKSDATEFVLVLLCYKSIQEKVDQIMSGVQYLFDQRVKNKELLWRIPCGSSRVDKRGRIVVAWMPRSHVGFNMGVTVQPDGEPRMG